MSVNPLYGAYAFSLIMTSEAFQKTAGKQPEKADAGIAEMKAETREQNPSRGPEAPNRG